MLLAPELGAASYVV